MTRAVAEVVGPETPILCALEGGYAIDVICDCMEAVTLAMLNCPFSYHSTQLMESYYSFGGAASPECSHCTDRTADHTCSCCWSAPGNDNERLQRGRRVLANYYIHSENIPATSMLLKSAIQDINTCIRIFRGIPRWNNVHLRSIKTPPSSSQSQQLVSHHKRSCSDDGTRGWTEYRPGQRPRIYLWYGTEEHHHRKGIFHGSRPQQYSY
jgi:hypothetical protein